MYFVWRRKKETKVGHKTKLRELIMATIEHLSIVKQWNMMLEVTIVYSGKLSFEDTYYWEAKAYF